MKKFLSSITVLLLLFCLFASIQVVSAASPKNLALAATATQDPNGLNRSDVYAPQKAIDGDKTTRWAGNAQIDADDEKFPVKDETWLRLEFPSEAEFDKVVIDWHGNRASKDGFIIQYSNDNKTWTDVKGKYSHGKEPTESKNADDVHVIDTVTFDTAKAKYLRVWITNAISKDGPGIWEFEVYNTKNPDFEFGKTTSEATSEQPVSSTAVSSAATSQAASAADSTAVSSKATSSAVSSQAKDGENNWWIWAVVAAVVIVGAVIAAVVIGKKKK